MPEVAPYLQGLMARNPSAKPAQLEREIIRSEAWHVSPEEHVLSYFAHLIPEWDIHRWRKEMILDVWKCIQNGTQEYNAHGSSNCHKTSTFGLIVLGFYGLFPELTSMYLTSPYKEASESGLWAQVAELFDDIKMENPWFPGKITVSTHRIDFDKRKFPRSFIKLVTSDEVGKLLGRKPKRVRGQKSYIFFVCDEGPEIKGRKAKQLIKLLANLKSNKGFLSMVAGNFGEPDDLLGLLSMPKRTGGYAALDVEKDHHWHTRRGGFCRRFDGEFSPNIIEHPPGKYVGLTDSDTVASTLRDSGGDREHPLYMRFIRSFPVLGFAAYRILSQKDLEQGEPERKGMFMNAPVTVGYCDPAFGGRDPAKVQTAEVGKVTFQGKTSWIVDIHEPIIVPITAGEDSDDQCASFCMDLCLEKGIKPEHFGFDGSLRASIVQAFMAKSINFQPIDNLGKPTDRRYPIGSKSVPAKDVFANYNTEQHFVIPIILRSKQLIGIQRNEEAVSNLQARRWNFASGRRRRVQSKEEYRSENGGHSPTGADILVGVVQMAFKAGFALDIAKGNQQGGTPLENFVKKQAKAAKAVRTKRKLNRNRR